MSRKMFSFFYLFYKNKTSVSLVLNLGKLLNSIPQKRKKNTHEGTKISRMTCYLICSWGKMHSRSPDPNTSICMQSSTRVWFSFNFSFFYVLQDKLQKVAHLG